MTAERRECGVSQISTDEIVQDLHRVFAEEDEADETKGLWDTQVADLKHVLGSA